MSDLGLGVVRAVPGLTIVMAPTVDIYVGLLRRSHFDGQGGFRIIASCDLDVKVMARRPF